MNILSFLFSWSILISELVETVKILSVKSFVESFLQNQRFSIKAKFDIFTKNVDCYEINQAMGNVSCRVKVTRAVPTGLMRITIDPVFVDDLFIRFRLFYRYTGGFKPYLLDFNVDVCELLSEKNLMIGHPAIMRLATALKKAFPTLFGGCPYKDPIDSGWYDNNATFSPILPPIIAAGRYKFYCRLYTSKNETLAIYENQIEFKPTREYRAMGRFEQSADQFNNNFV